MKNLFGIVSLSILFLAFFLLRECKTQSRKDLYLNKSIVVSGDTSRIIDIYYIWDYGFEYTLSDGSSVSESYVKSCNCVID